MHNKILLLICSFIINSYAFAQGTKWNIYTFFDGQIYPSYSWAASYLGEETINERGNLYGDQMGQVGVALEGLKKGQRIKIEIAENDIMDNTVLEFEIGDLKTEVLLANPQILYKWSELEKWRQPKPINMKVTVSVNGKLHRTDSKRIIVRSINDCPFAMALNNMLLDLNYVYLSYVNENHPLITDVILPEIMKDGILKSISGYQEGNKEAVYKQVYAVWQYFNKKEFYYSSLENKYKMDGMPIIWSQHVRTFSDIYKTKQANCVEGTVLMASILTRMGINSYLVTTPSHCFLGFSLDKDGNETAFLETTLLGSSVEQLSEEVQQTLKTISLTGSDNYYRLTFGKNSYDLFIYALMSGLSNFNSDEGKYRDHTHEPYLLLSENLNVGQAFQTLNYRLLSVSYYRKLGLMPINL